MHCHQHNFGWHLTIQPTWHSIDSVFGFTCLDFRRKRKAINPNKYPLKLQLSESSTKSNTFYYWQSRKCLTFKWIRNAEGTCGFYCQLIQNSCKIGMDSYKLILLYFFLSKKSLAHGQYWKIQIVSINQTLLVVRFDFSQLQLHFECLLIDKKF